MGEKTRFSRTSGVFPQIGITRTTIKMAGNGMVSHSFEMCDPAQYGQSNEGGLRPMARKQALAVSASADTALIRSTTTVLRRSRWLLMLLVMLNTAALTGCSIGQSIGNYLAYNDTQNDFVMGWRNQVWARQAWHEQKYQFAGHQQFRAFGEGFRAGYVSVASGGGSCPPAVPPRKYWSWKYQTPEGQCKVAAWFEGFTYGAQAAESDGAGNFQQIQVSHAIEVQYSPEFQAGKMPVVMEPIPQGQAVPNTGASGNYVPGTPLPATP